MGRTGGRRQDHYEVLGLHSDAPSEVIRAAYRALAAKYHPDRNPGDPGAGLKLKRLNAAFEVLSDPRRKTLYDELTRSPEASDETPSEPPENEPPRSRVSEEPQPEEARSEVPREEDRPRSNPQAAGPSHVERVATHAARGFGRVAGWLTGAALAAAIIAALHGGGDEKPRGDQTSTPATAAPIVASAKQWVWITQPNYRVAFPETPRPAETATERKNWGVVNVTSTTLDRPSGAAYWVVQTDYQKTTFSSLPLAERERTLNDATEGDFLVALGPTTLLEYDQPATVGDCNGRRASATVGTFFVRWALCAVGLRVPTRQTAPLTSG
jgi:curved DNA-binding protein CbpA